MKTYKPKYIIVDEKTGKQVLSTIFLTKNLAYSILDGLEKRNRKLIVKEV